LAAELSPWAAGLTSSTERNGSWAALASRRPSSRSADLLNCGAALLAMVAGSVMRQTRMPSAGSPFLLRHPLLDLVWWLFLIAVWVGASVWLFTSPAVDRPSPEPPP